MANHRTWKRIKRTVKELGGSDTDLDKINYDLEFRRYLAKLIINHGLGSFRGELERLEREGFKLEPVPESLIDVGVEAAVRVMDEERKKREERQALARKQFWVKIWSWLIWPFRWLDKRKEYEK